MTFSLGPARVFLAASVGICDARCPLGIQGLGAVVVGHALPLVEAGPGDAEHPTGLGHIVRRPREASGS